MHRRSGALLAILLVACVCRAGDGPAGAQPEPAKDPHAEVRGMTISCPTWGWEWGSDEMVDTMRLLAGRGVNWVCIHPYAGIRGDGTVVVHERSFQDTTWLRRPIEEAHRLGLKIMINPHLAYWGSPFSWRGEIRFERDEDWRRFFDTYRQWIVRLTETCAAADAFAVGNELDATAHFEQEWRDIIAAVRQRLRVPLTYCANWDRYEQVPFWDALDVIGIQGYFPLVEHGNLPEPRELERAWAGITGRLEEFSRRHGGRKILLAELGYNRSALAAQRPWEYAQGGPNAEETQCRCLEAALKALEGDDTIVGAFLWKWFPGEVERGNFILSAPATQRIIAEHWGGEAIPRAP